MEQRTKTTTAGMLQINALRFECEKLGNRYCRTLKEVDAIKVDRERLCDLQKFTGGGTMTIPRIPGGLAKYEFKDDHGIIITAQEYECIVREESGKVYVMDYLEFIRDYELKYPE